MDQVGSDQQGTPGPAQLFGGESVGGSFPRHGDRQSSDHMPEIVGVADAHLQVGVVASNP